MKLLISCMGYDGGKSGISAYMRAVLAKLKNADGLDITLLTEPDCDSDFEGFKRIKCPQRFSKAGAGFLWHLFCAPFYARKFDCFLILAANRRFVLWGTTPTVGVVHDLSQYRVKGKYDALRMFYLSKIQPMLGRRINRMAAISMSTKEDVEKYWNIPSDRIELNYNGVSPLGDGDDSVLERLKLGKYIYYVSRIEHPGKNHINLMKAFERLPDNSELQLVFTGSDWNGAETVRDYAKNSPCSDRIIFTGFVSNAELASLYRNAACFAFPSFSEGFGLGLVEAMGAGVPCVCSRDSALGEVAADAALTFDPHSPEEISADIEKVLTDEKLREDLIEKGLRRAKDFDWQRHADKLAEMSRAEASKFDTLEIFGVDFVNARMSDVVAKLDSDVKNARKKTVAFINAYYLNTAYEDRQQLGRLKKFDYVLPDGSGVSIACKMLSYPYRDNLNGTDLLPNLCELAQKEGLSMYFIGGRETVAQRAADNLIKCWGNLKIVGARSGYFSKEEEDAIIDEINAANPDLLFVGFGVKLQEKWVLANRDKINAPIMLAVGGLFSFYSGELYRAHPKLREWGLEWLVRLYQEPIRLFARYIIGNPLFIFRVIKYKFFGMGKAR